MHKMDPCRGRRRVRSFEFVRTGTSSDDFAWGASDASGSLISSVKELALVVQILLGAASTDILPSRVLNEIMTAQMITPATWNSGCGLR